MARSTKLPMEANHDKLRKQVDMALAVARAKKRKTAGMLAGVKEKLEVAQSIEADNAVALGEALDELLAEYNRLLEIHLKARTVKTEIVVRENGRVVRTLGEDDLVNDVLELIEQDIVSRSLDSDEAVFAAGSEWLTRLTMAITRLIRVKD